jgi:DNA (cytosine-5)-methyltransferase 1
MNHGSLFSGIGGFDLAARWMGWDNVFHVEWNPWCRKVLEHHFPNSESFTDVRQFDGSAWRGRVDIISGGFPCQPYSSAGKRLGKDDERHLWPEMLRIIREAAPTYVVGENVRGLTNWSGGVVFEEVCADLEAEGYEVWTGILPAAGVGAPHRRDRVWFVAHANGGADVRTPGRHAGTGTGEGIPERHEVRIPDKSSDVWDATDTDCQRSGTLSKEVEPEKSIGQWPICNGGESDAADTDGDGVSRQPVDVRTSKNPRQRRENFAENGHLRDFRGWESFPTESPICGGNDGISRELDGITFSKWRNESIKAYGNAIVPQVAYQIFQAIQNANE